jgi:hypothetical protein
MRFEVLTATNIKTAVFWDVVQCSILDINSLFRVAYCLYREGILPRISNLHEISE